MARRYDGAYETTKDGVYSVELRPRLGAPTYAYGVFGYQNARVGTLNGASLEKFMDKYERTRYKEHYQPYVRAVNTRGIGGDLDKKIADRNSDPKELNKVFDQTMKRLDTFYRHSLTRDYGSEWYYENQPTGGSSSNS